MSNKHFIIIIFNCIVILVLAIKSPLYASTCTDNDNDSYAVEGGLCGTPDCDDQDNRVFPGALKICDGKDNNCDGKLDFTTDKDDDGDGVPWCGGDCNDNDPNRSPLNREGPSGDLTCNDGIDNDCDNRIDFIDPECLTSCQDNDGDGFGNPGSPDCPNGPVTDCNDIDPGINPGHIVYCDETNSDCNSYVTLRWRAPVNNVDGSDLNDLAGYKIHYGSMLDNYMEPLEIGNNTCHVIGNLTPGEWCFAVTAYDINGNESNSSNEICKFMN